jgi:hypothetical protein
MAACWRPGGEVPGLALVQVRRELWSAGAAAEGAAAGIPSTSTATTAIIDAVAQVVSRLLVGVVRT